MTVRTYGATTYGDGTYGGSSPDNTYGSLTYGSGAYGSPSDVGTSLMGGGGPAQLVRSTGTAGPVQGFRARGELAGARLAVSLPFTAFLQSQDGFAQQAQGSVAITGTMAAVEIGSDVFSAEGVVRIIGVMSAMETDSDIFSATGTVQSPGNSGGEYIVIFRRRRRL